MQNHIYLYKLFQELKLTAEAVLKMYCAKGNSIIASKDKLEKAELEIRIALQRSYLDKLDDIVSNYFKTFASLMHSYQDKEALAFKCLVFEAKDFHTVAKELDVTVSQVETWFKSFEKDLKNIRIETI